MNSMWLGILITLGFWLIGATNFFNGHCFSLIFQRLIDPLKNMKINTIFSYLGYFCKPL